MQPTRTLARAVALGAAILVMAGGAAAADIPDEDALPDDAIAADRYAGMDRYRTAGLTALATYPDGADMAVLARGDAFPDGLAASYLAGVKNAPILLTRPNVLPLETQDAFEGLGTERVVIVGGPAAIDQNVEDRLVELFGEDDVDRISGADRFSTASFVFNQTGTLGSLGDLSGDSDRDLRTAIVASGRNFPDALAAGPLAHAARLPILLTEKDTLPDLTRFALENDVQQVVVAGGPVSVSPAVVDEIASLEGIEVVERISGADRTATAVQLAELARAQLGWPGEAVTIALGTDFPDALSLAPAASRMQAPILLARSTDDLGAPTFAAVQETCETLGDVVIAGGEVAVGATAELQVELATSCADHQFLLDPDEVVPGPGDPSAAGTGWLWTESLCTAVRTQDLSSEAVRAELHRADPGQDGPLAAVLTVPRPTTGDGIGIGCLTEQDVRDGTPDDLRAALAEDPAGFHVDVDSSGHPGGAVRGQVAVAPEDA